MQDSTESSAVLCLAEGSAKVTLVLGFQVASSQKVLANLSCLLIESQFLSCELMVNTWVAKFPLSHNYPPPENGSGWMQTVHSTWNVFADYAWLLPQTLSVGLLLAMSRTKIYLAVVSAWYVPHEAIVAILQVHGCKWAFGLSFSSSVFSAQAFAVLIFWVCLSFFSSDFSASAFTATQFCFLNSAWALAAQVFYVAVLV